MDELVSVIMSTYNEPFDYIEKAIKSILNQTWKNIEFIIVIDNPENEELVRFINQYKGNKKVIIIQNDMNRGLPYSLNRAIQKSGGKYIARMDADDISCKQRIEEEIAFLEKYNLDMVASSRIDIDEDGHFLGENIRTIKADKINKVLPHVCIINHPSILIKADILKGAGGYRQLKAAQDYELWLRLLSEKRKIGIIETPLIYYRIRSSSIGKRNCYLQRLMTEYAQLLFYERKCNGSDSYCEEHIANYLKESGYEDEAKKEQYIIAAKHLETGVKKCRQKDMAGLLNILQSLKNRHIRKLFKDLLIMKWYT